MKTDEEPCVILVGLELDELEWTIDALEAQMSQTPDQRSGRLQQARQRVSEVLDQIKGEIARTQALAEEKKARLAAAVDELKVQLALGQAEARESLEVERQKLDRALAEFEATERLELLRMERSLEHYYEHARDRLKAELNAAAIRVREEKAHVGAAFARRKEELRSQLLRHKQLLEAERQRREEKWQQFQSDVRPAIREIGDAVNQLLR